MCNEFIEKIGMIFGFLCTYLAEAVCIGLLSALCIWGLFDSAASFISYFPCFRKIKNRKKENKFVCSRSSCMFRYGCPNYYVNILVDKLEKLTLQDVEVKEDE